MTMKPVPTFVIEQNHIYQECGLRSRCHRIRHRPDERRLEPDQSHDGRDAPAGLRRQAGRGPGPGSRRRDRRDGQRRAGVQGGRRSRPSGSKGRPRPPGSPRPTAKQRQADLEHAKAEDLASLHGRRRRQFRPSFGRRPDGSHGGQGGAGIRADQGEVQRLRRRTGAGDRSGRRQHRHHPHRPRTRSPSPPTIWPTAPSSRRRAWKRPSRPSARCRAPSTRPPTAPAMHGATAESARLKATEGRRDRRPGGRPR